ncbi:hypothetical protein J2Z83_003501 [Virgibacillus natechei]|uniref:PH domain-containing protein n=1 Tax=Virgibacillus natechei TaxID=1216297 RepID=A0ABS4IK59_9BACI|nr:hypothetical protein [Virgibacillus natechei]MBP1971362.1 hypothetical protein [Virgibacillus natechei]UZD12260.1 hypothetical protein OLD84_15205 [Virgibacillus natechei]
MAFHYGSDAPEIKNPFKQEGLLYLISGIIILIVGAISIINLREQIIENGVAAGWFSLAVSLLLLTGGVHFVTKGLIKISRFYVGRGVPASLSKNMARSEKHTKESDVYYNSQQIEQMMMGRKNLTFHEPVTLFDRMVYSIYPKFIFLPLSMRNYLHILVQNTGYSIIGLIVYFMALLSGTVGLTLLTESSFSDWLGIALCVFLLALWTAYPLTVNKATDKNSGSGKNSQLVWVIALAVLVPAIAELLLRQGFSFPEAPFNPTLALFSFFFIIIVVCAAGLALAHFRTKVADPVTEVSEFREHWQENVHPKDFFRALDMEMADLRYKEIPNRIYRELNPNLNMEGSMDKGSFSGDTIQEIQPIYEKVSYPPLLEKSRLGVAIVGHSFVILAAVLLFFINQNGAGDVSTISLFNGIFYPVVLYVSGNSLLTFAHLYWGEMQFRSHLIQFQGEGTYSESKLSVGMAITDSTRSENTVVRTSYSSWFLVTEIVTSTQARSGVNTLDRPRYILSMNKADELKNHLVDQMREFLDERELIASSASNKDGNAIQSIYAINEVAAGKEKLSELTQENKELAYTTNEDK